MKILATISKQMRYWQELMKNTTFNNAMGTALRNIHHDGIKKNHDVLRQIKKENAQDNKRLKELHYLIALTEQYTIIFYPNGKYKYWFPKK